MKILNLTNLEQSEIKYEISHFPDGQQQIKLDKDTISTKTVQIKARLNNFLDLEVIVCAVKSLRGLGVKEIHLYTPYFLGSRSDRKFEEGSDNYLKDVICPIVNGLKLDSVEVIDPHSDVLEACLNNFKKIDNFNLIRYATNNYQYENQKKSGVMSEDFVLISPDAGATKKIFKLASQIGYEGDIITCTKDRGFTGRISKTIVPLLADHKYKDFIIIDDICDGGATFINIAKAIKSQHNLVPVKIYLIVTHGIFSKGFKELNKYFNGIYCTNSYMDLKDPEIAFKFEKEMYKVKQSNVF